MDNEKKYFFMDSIDIMLGLLTRRRFLTTLCWPAGEEDKNST